MSAEAPEKAPAKGRAGRATVPAPSTSSTSSSALDELTGGGVPADVALERVEVDPKALVLDANARAELKITPAFRALIREHGVLVPLLCRRDALGQLLVVDGQRRLVVALEEDLPSVPIALLPPVGDDEARLWDQLVTNDGREPLTDGEQIRAYQQLSLMGRSAETIAKRTAQSVDVVTTALRVAGSKVASKAMVAKPDLTLDQLAAVVEFEEDAAAVKELKAVADDPGRFRQALSTLRTDRAIAEATAAAVASLPEGTTVLSERSQHSGASTESLRYLADKPGGKALTPEGHADCPGHAAYAFAQAGWSGNDRIYVPSVEYYCTTWKTAGHYNKYATPGSGATSGPKTEEEKAEGRTLRANNKAAEAAEPVRRAFVHEVLQRKTLPADAAVYVTRILRAGTQVGRSGDHALASTLLYGAKEISDRDRDADLKRPDRALRYLVALAASVVEPMPKDFWHKRQAYGSAPRRIHLEQLKAWGYTLADVEQLALDNMAKEKAR